MPTNLSTEPGPLLAFALNIVDAYRDLDIHERDASDNTEDLANLVDAAKQAIAKHEAAPAAATIDLSTLLTDELNGPATLDVLLDALLVTAIEGGSTYWCARVETPVGKQRPRATDHGEAEGMPWYTVAFQSGTEMRVLEDDDGRQTWRTLDRAAGIRGLRLLVEGKHCGAHIVTDLIQNKDGADAGTADVWLQLATLGGVVYG
jgi:hypothetical protein